MTADAPDRQNAGTRAAESGVRPLLRAVALGKAYPAPDGRSAPVTLFHELALEVAPGEMVAILGRSGAGKSTLLHLLAGLEAPTRGEVWLGDQPLHALKPDALTAVRSRGIGYVWQFHYLLPEFSAEENIALPLLARGESRRTALAAAQGWLQRIGLAGRGHHRSGELSGGEQQRVAIARALAMRPQILLADEPTGDLDEDTAAQLFGELRRLCTEEALAAVLVTHNEEIARGCNRALRLTDGRLQPVLMA